MKNLYRMTLAGIIMLASTGVNAELIKGDWKVANDNLSIIDTQTGIEWLSLKETDGLSIASVQSQLETTFSGWRLPTSGEVAAMMDNVMPSTTVSLTGQTYGYETVLSRPENLAFGHLFGWTHGYPGNTMYPESTGLHLFKEYGPTYVAKTGVSYPHTAASRMIVNQVLSQNLNDTGGGTSGVFLVSDGGVSIESINNPMLNANNANSPYNATSVPLPATGALLALALSGFAVRRKQK